MPWGRIDDSLYDHPKLDELPGEGTWPDRLAAVGLNYIAVSWCNRHLTDGRIPRDRIEKLGGSEALAELLVKAGLWDRERGGGYRVHDFLVYNDSKAQVVARREKEAARKAAWRARSHAGSPGGTDDGVPGGVPPSVPPGHGGMSRVVSRRPSRDSSRANPDPNPTRPDPAESNTTPPTPSPARGRRNGATSAYAQQYDAGMQRDSDDEPEPELDDLDLTVGATS